MLTGRYLHRERLNEAFTQAELVADPRLGKVLDQILSRTIIEEAQDRIQSAPELKREVESLLLSLRQSGGDSGPTYPPPRDPVPPPVPVERTGTIISAYQSAASDLSRGDATTIRLKFDRAQQIFLISWVDLLEERKAQLPVQSAAVARSLIDAQHEAVALTLLVSRMDALDLYADVHKLLESILQSTNDISGYPAVLGIPHVLAGFLYMTAAVNAFMNESWRVLKALLHRRFEWYYQSGRPLYNYGFGMTYFFHSEALGREASKSHDLFRELLSHSSISEVMGRKPEAIVDAYLQTHMLMCMRAAQLSMGTEPLQVFADFGRFYGGRVLPVIDRIYADREYGESVAAMFGETRQHWLAQVNQRMQFMHEHYWGGSRFWWESIKTWEPR
jgi:hypothetical protein